MAEKIPANNVNQYITPCTSQFGPDKITIKLLKAAGYTRYESLLYIFNLVLVTGIFLDDLKQSRVILILKEGDKSECRNYRPISVVSAIAN